MTVELLVNPCCMANRDVGVVENLCAKYQVPLRIHNPWDIDDQDIDQLPEHVSVLLRKWRTGKRPGTVYSSVFVNKERIPLDNWPKHMEVLEEKIVSLVGGEKR